MNKKSFEYKKITVLGIMFLFLILKRNLVSAAPLGTCGLNIDPANPTGFPTPQSVAGIDWIRIEFKDCTYSNESGSEFYNTLAAYKTVISGYRSQGINVLLIIDYQSYPREGDFVNIDSFAERAGIIAQTFGNSGMAYQIWNEPDIDQGGNLAPDLYASLLAPTAQAIKSSSGARVITAGLASGQAAWLSALVTSMGGSWGNIDAVSLHPYGKVPGTGACAIGNTGPLEPCLAEHYAAGGNKPIWISEIGLNTNDDSAQADYLECFHDVLQYHSEVQQVMWFCWSDGMVPPFGIVTASGITKTSYNSFFTHACQVGLPSQVSNISPPLNPVADDGASCAPPGGTGTWGPGLGDHSFQQCSVLPSTPPSGEANSTGLIDPDCPAKLNDVYDPVPPMFLYPSGSPGGEILDCEIDLHDTNALDDTSTNNPFFRRYSAIYPTLTADRWNYLISTAIANGWNPALLIALWAEETHFGDTSLARSFGCGVYCSNPPTTFEESLACVIGNCATCCNAVCPTDDFMSWANCYGPPASNPNFIPNLVIFYSELDPLGVNCTFGPGGGTATQGCVSLSKSLDQYCLETPSDVNYTISINTHACPSPLTEITLTDAALGISQEIRDLSETDTETITLTQNISSTFTNTARLTATMGTEAISLSQSATVNVRGVGGCQGCEIPGVPYYCQREFSDVCIDVPNNANCDAVPISGYGCGICSEAMIGMYYGSAPYPQHPVQYACANFGICWGYGNGPLLMGRNLYEIYNGCTSRDEYLETIRTNLCDNGNILMGHWYYVVGHYFVIVGIDDTTNEVILNDPYWGCADIGGSSYMRLDFETLWQRAQGRNCHLYR